MYQKSVLRHYKEQSDVAISPLALEIQEIASPA